MKDLFTWVMEAEGDELEAFDPGPSDNPAPPDQPAKAIGAFPARTSARQCYLG